MMRGVVSAMLIGAMSATAGGAAAAEPVTIGAIYPMTGAGAAIGAEAKAAIETAAEIVNTSHPGLDTLPLGAGAGLPGLGGARLAVAFADDQANPSVAVSQVVRLKSTDRAAALIGAGDDAMTLAATAQAERAGLPFLVPDATAPQVTGRGFAWIFRTTPLAGDIAQGYMAFLAAVKASGGTVASIGLVHEATERGRAVAAALRDAAQAAGFGIGSEYDFAPGSTDLSAAVAGLRDSRPDVVIAVASAADAGLLVTTMNTLGYRPPLLIGDDAGFSDPRFVAADGNLAQGLVDRSAWRLGDAGSASAIVNQLYKARAGRDLDDTGARVLQGFLVLADAINRAGSTEPAAIRDALRQTDLKADQLIVGYNGVKFDATGQNTLGATYLTQLQGKTYATVWPAASATASLMLPFKGGL